MNLTRTKQTALALTATALAFMLTACGGGSDATSAASSQAPSVAATTGSGASAASAAATSAGQASAASQSTAAAASSGAASTTPVATAANGTTTLFWSAPLENTDGTMLTDLAGYHVYYGTDPSNLDHVADVSGPQQFSFTASSLTSGVWYFMVDAYTTAGSESPRSEVASTTIA